MLPLRLLRQPSPIVVELPLVEISLPRLAVSPTLSILVVDPSYVVPARWSEIYRRFETRVRAHREVVQRRVILENAVGNPVDLEQGKRSTNGADQSAALLSRRRRRRRRREVDKFEVEADYEEDEDER